MNKYGYVGDERFRPLSPWAYFGYTLLFSIPIVGFILLIVFSLTSDNINRRNFARSYFVLAFLLLIIVAVLLVSGVITFTFWDSNRYGFNY